MSGKEVSLYLKVPSKPPTLLHRLENSLLESLIEYKPINASTADLKKIRIFDVPSLYQTKGSVEVVDSELLVQFTARNVGIHTGRIFANTKEVCRPVVFLVKPSGDVESINYTSSHLEYTDSGLVSGTSTVRGVESQPTMASYIPASPPTSPPPLSPSQQSPPPFFPQPSIQQHSSLVYKPSSRPPSGAFSDQNEKSYPGDLFGRPLGATFQQLLVAKETKQVVPGISSRPTSMTKEEVMTSEKFQYITKEAKKSVGANFGLKIKKRCDICSRKIKSKKCVTFWETDYCDSCCKRNFMLRSAIEHFMAPSIKECTVQVPLNKRGTKIANTKKIMPNVNLRGLEPGDVRNAMMEFHKFDVEGDGWMSKVVLMPVLKACFTYTLPDKEIRSLLTSQSLASMIETMGISSRDKIHHVEFLALLAFIARERQRLNHDLIPNSKFTHSDLEMAYAFQRQFGKQYKQHVPAVIQPPPLYKQEQLMTKSFTDSPLSQYQPTSLVTDDNMISSSPSSPIQKVPPADDEKMEEEKETNETVEVNDEQEVIGQSKKGKGDMMEQYKLTGDKGADGWMMY